MTNKLNKKTTMKIAKFNLRVGTKLGQEGYEQKLAQGREYVETLRREDKVIEVIETRDEIIIKMED